MNKGVFPLPPTLDLAFEPLSDYIINMRSPARECKKHRIKESYRNQAYIGVISLDPWTNSWAWKAHIDFDAGLHAMFTNRTFMTSLQAEEHMRQFAHQCIDNRLG